MSIHLKNVFCRNSFDKETLSMNMSGDASSLTKNYTQYSANHELKYN